VTEVLAVKILTVAFVVLAAVVFVVLFFISAPYGRHARRGWGPTVRNRLGWLVMEAPAPTVFVVCFVLGTYTQSTPERILLLLWMAHYVHRAFLYPFQLDSAGRRMPIAVVILGFVFNGLNAYLNGRHVFTFSGGYGESWLADPRFLIGVALFSAGFVVNRHSDKVLRLLRAPGESGYHIPTGGMYRWVSSPNYLGEILEWTGWAIATWSLAGVAFTLWALANLAPRARSHHKWYQEQFPDYPQHRRVLLPGVW